MKVAENKPMPDPVMLPPAPKWDIGPTYVFQKELGTGTYGSVCEAIVADTGDRVAIKRFTDLFKDQVMCKRILREIEILYSLNHELIVRPFDMFTRNNNTEVYLVMELGQSNLKNLFMHPVYLDPKQIQLLMYRLLVALNYLHSGGIVHRDVKPDNILVNEDCSIHLCDFSISRSTAGLRSCGFDCDMAIRRNPKLNMSVSSFNSLASMSLQSLSATRLDEMEEDADEFAEGTASNKKKIVSGCSFEVKFPKAAAATSTPTAKPDKSAMEERKKQGKPKALTTADKERILESRKRLQRESLLDRLKEIVPEFERELTGHIGSRWYRSPEIVLFEKIYTTSVDVWAAGCVFAELLQMMIKNQPDYHKRRPLFPGDSCFPFSPSAAPTVYVGGFPVSAYDQFNMILSVKGTPGKDDVSFVEDKTAQEYIKGFASVFGVYPKVNLKDAFKAADPLAIDLLERLLTFNPYYRITVQEALKHRYFEDIRNKAIETEFMEPVHLQTEDYSYDQIMPKAIELLYQIRDHHLP
ncbi:MAG: protein kinase [Candidatus Pacebacteria bacterium]|nr:protein kinase [Candidatus Paceibacterota bacterium]